MKNLLKRIAIIKAMIKVLQGLLLLVKNKKGFKEFAEALGQRESSGNYKIVNAYGYMGKYQFGMARLCDLGYTERIGKGYDNKAFDWKKGYSQEYFLGNPDFQDKVFKEHCNNFIKSIKLKFSKYLGQEVNGIKITLSGCVAFCHLAGIGGLSNFLRGLGEGQDALGTKGSDYIKQFNGYKL